jgi:hypothetical protein
MAYIQVSLKASSWKKFFLDIKSLDYSNKMLPEITASANPDLPPVAIFETISKNPGIGLLCLDMDCKSITMFHNHWSYWRFLVQLGSEVSRFTWPSKSHSDQDQGILDIGHQAACS